MSNTVVETLPEITQEDREVLLLVNDPKRPVAVMPVNFNGETRLALVTPVPGGCVRILGVLIKGTDEIRDMHGRRPTAAPTNPMAN